MKMISVSEKDHILTVTLNRPDLHNAFNAEMISEIRNVFENIPGSARVVILRGAGKSFSAGADLSWMKSMANFTYEENLKDAKETFNMFDAVYSCPIPVICKVHGSVFGGGLGLLAACDIAASIKETKFCFSEVKVGIVPAIISGFVLKKAPQNLARQMMLTGQVFNEDKAFEMGLLQFIGDEEEVEDFIQSQAEFVLAGGPEAVKNTKHLLNFVSENDWRAVKDETTRVIAERRVSSEGQEGLKAFFEKRKPSWKS